MSHIVSRHDVRTAPAVSALLELLSGQDVARFQRAAGYIESGRTDLGVAIELSGDTHRADAVRDILAKLTGPSVALTHTSIVPGKYLPFQGKALAAIGSPKAPTASVRDAVAACLDAGLVTYRGKGRRSWTGEATVRAVIRTVRPADWRDLADRVQVFDFGGQRVSYGQAQSLLATVLSDLDAVRAWAWDGLLTLDQRGGKF